MATSRFNTADRGRQMASPRPKTRDTKDTLCRNVVIYGHCRYEDQGCAFNHDQNKTSSSNSLLANEHDSAKKTFNADSPSFTPSQLQSGGKKHTFSSQTVNAAVFTPKAVPTSTTPILSDSESPYINPATIREFTPQSQNYDLNTAGTSNGVANESTGNMYDPYSMSNLSQTLPTPQYNPYAEDHNSLAAAATAASFYSTQAGYTAPMQPLQYHLYAPVGPSRQDLTPYQRQAHDFFLPNDLREDLQKKSAATRLVLPNSQLPAVSHYHSLVPLDSPKGGHSIFGNYVCWVYKATSKKNGNVYCLRRLQGARVNSRDSTTIPMAKWKRINNGSIVTPVECFTSRDFNDNSLIFIHNYHPNSKTLAEHHFSPSHSNRFGRPPVQENVLWAYISQICNGLQAIHSEGLAARCIDLTKIILTENNRIRLGACLILDVLEYENSRPLIDQQQQDLVDLGKIILHLALNMATISNVGSSFQQLERTNYSADLKQTVRWLISPSQTADRPKSVHELASGISHHLFASYDAAFHACDEMNSALHSELENGRVARLLLKLGTINERPEFDNDPNWSENGERYQLKLFRDFVFHQVDNNGNPVLDLGMMLSRLNKLDAGVEERVYLTSRDQQTLFAVTYKELKKQVANAFNELLKASNQAKPGGAASTAGPPRGGY
ncbi:PAB-dependent poly(A)-specific ribonuclease subunit PAN3 [Xylariales sp. PMI_506]|nr:PAB-dependent poly(A)-specific ribonuclease subunit PAN3 [Xylariales sp. PMI_506]